MRSTQHFVVFALATLVLAPQAQAASIHFGELLHGERIANQYDHLGVSFDVYNSYRNHGVGVAFDTERGGTADPDLERGADWATGNRQGDVLGKVLIIQEALWSCDSDSCWRPDDEGARPAGTIDIGFDQRIRSFGLDLVDIDDVSMEMGSITLFDDALATSLTVGFEDLVDAGSAFFDPTVAFGDNSANRVEPFVAMDLGFSGWNRVRIAMGGSGAIDRLQFERAIPEPTAALVFAAGIATVASTRRFRR